MLGISTEPILGYRVVSSLLQDCIDNIFEQVDKKRVSWLACFNPHSYAVSLTDRPFADALKASTWLVPDGVGVVYASRVLGGGIRKRITGSDIFFNLLLYMNDRGGMSMFFLGASEETLSMIRARVAADYPRIRLAGTYSPPFKREYSADELEQMVDAINSTQPDVLWVGMTAPKQELWIADNLAKLDIRFAAAIGAVFDFYAGKVQRSHPVLQQMGLEWLPRLIRQPRRLWRRMFVSAPVFIWHVFKAKLKW